MRCYSGNLNNVHEAIIVQTFTPNLCEPIGKQLKKENYFERN